MLQGIPTASYGVPLASAFCHYEPVSLSRDDRQGEAFPTVSSLDAGQDKENIAKTSALPHESSPRVTSLDANEGTIKIKDQDMEISRLKARVKSLEDKERRGAEPTQKDALIIRGIIEIREELRADKSTELGSNDTEEMVNVLSSMEATNILTSGGAAASVSPAEVLPAAGVPTVSGSFPTLARDFKIARLHNEEELKMMIEGLDRSNEVIVKHLQEYEQSEDDLSIGEKLKLINELEQREFYMAVFRSHAGWKTKYFRGMTLEQIKEKFIPVWKQLEDFVPISLKEEGERVKRQGLKIDQGNSKRMKTSEDVSEEELKGMMQLVPLEEVYVEALQGGFTSAVDFGKGNFKYQTGYKRQGEGVIDLIPEEGKDNVNNDTESKGYGSTFKDETDIKSNGFIEFSGVHNEPVSSISDYQIMSMDNRILMEI
nr:hypothetical protein [Tanacetum cinerariifolium]